MNSLKVQFGLPEHGWISLTIETGGLKAWIEADSRFEAFYELIETLTAMWSGEEHVTASWYEEPNLAELHFHQTSGKVLLCCTSTRVYDLEGQTSNQTFQVEGNLVEVCLPFVRALLDLRKSVPKENWLELAQDDFPEQEFQDLLETLKAHPETQEHFKM